MTSYDDEREACGDYPAPCNCDDPETHDGALRRQGPITNTQVDAAATRAEAWFSEPPWWLRDMVIATLEAARDASPSGMEDSIV